MATRPQEPADDKQRGTVECDQCGQTHEATFSHMTDNSWEGPEASQPVYAVVCTVDDLTDYYLTERVAFTERPTLADVVARSQASSHTDPSWRGDFR